MWTLFWQSKQIWMFLVFSKVIVHAAYASNSWDSSPSRMTKTLHHGKFYTKFILLTFIQNKGSGVVVPGHSDHGVSIKSSSATLVHSVPCNGGGGIAGPVKCVPTTVISQTFNWPNICWKKQKENWTKELSREFCLFLIQEQLNLFLLIIILCTVVDALYLVWTNCSLQFYRIQKDTRS